VTSDVRSYFETAALVCAAAVAGLLSVSLLLLLLLPIDFAFRKLYDYKAGAPNPPESTLTQTRCATRPAFRVLYAGHSRRWWCLVFGAQLARIAPSGLILISHGAQTAPMLVPNS
jgi:hypothetical protein